MLRGPLYEAARKRLSGTVLAPSRVFDDSLWTARPDSFTRRLEFGTYVDSGPVRQLVAREVPPPARLGQARHIITLHQLGDGNYSWDTEIQIGFGTIRASQVADGIVTLLTAASAATPQHPEWRADYRTTFPHTTDVLAHMVSLDSLIVVPEPDGSARVTLGFTLQPDSLRFKYPAFAAYVNKYVSVTQYDFYIADASGHVYFDAVSSGAPMVVHARLRGREFLPLGGGETPLPDTLRLEGSFATHISLFTVGVRHFSSAFVIGRSAHERSWTLQFDEEPDWQLPLGMSHFLGSSLARPFEPPGITYRVAVRDSAGGQTILSRVGHAEVKESTLMRFLGGLISRVLLDQSDAVRNQGFAFIGETLDAMQLDFGALRP